MLHTLTLKKEHWILMFCCESLATCHVPAYLCSLCVKLFGPPGSPTGSHHCCAAGHDTYQLLWWGCPTLMLLVSVLLQSAILLDYRPFSSPRESHQAAPTGSSQAPPGEPQYLALKVICPLHVLGLAPQALPGPACLPLPVC